MLATHPGGKFRRRDVLQVDVVEPSLHKRVLDGRLGLLVSHRGDRNLGGVEDLGAVDTGVSNSVCRFALILV